MQAWRIFSGMHNERGALGFLALADERPEIIRARAAFVYAAYTSISRLQTTGGHCDERTFMRLIQERRIFIESRFPSLRQAIIDVRANPILSRSQR